LSAGAVEELGAVVALVVVVPVVVEVDSAGVVLELVVGGGMNGKPSPLLHKK